MSTVDIPIVATYYRPKPVQDFMARLSENPSLASISFQDEPDNPHDPQAIKVMARTDFAIYHVGYVPRTHTHILHEAWARHAIIEKELIPNTNVLRVTIRENEEFTIRENEPVEEVK